MSDPRKVPVVSGEVIEGVIVDYRAAAEKWAEAMVEATSEFDYRGGMEYSLPDEFREALTNWCANLMAWDRRQRQAAIPAAAPTSDRRARGGAGHDVDA